MVYTSSDRTDRDDKDLACDPLIVHENYNRINHSMK